jgi:nicotinate-nucleotide--dimethylbenzimidazole phosphoribosyltransferase
MTREELKKLINEIEEPDRAMMEKAAARQAELAKPPGSLGRLEDISVKIAGITGELAPNVTRQAIAVMSADNGVWEEGVACAPQSVTRAQTINFTRRLTGVGALSKNFGVDLLVTDVGVLDPIPDELYTDRPEVAVGAAAECATGSVAAIGKAVVTEKGVPAGIGVLTGTGAQAGSSVKAGKIWNRKIRPATNNIYKEAAMTEEEALLAIETGIEAARTLKKLGYGMIGVGEMGIGNTTTSTCLLAEFTGVPAAQIVGKGGGLSSDGYERKKAVVSGACERAEGELGDRREDPIAVLAELGGFDIAAMAGAYIGAAACRLPVVIDGYISVVAALAADRIFDYYRRPEAKAGQSGCLDATAPAVRAGQPGKPAGPAFRLADFMFASHKSFERGYEVAVEALGLEPMLLLGMRLGEGSGCPIAFKVIESAVAVMRDMATFEEAAINDDYLDEIRLGDSF